MNSHKLENITTLELVLSYFPVRVYIYDLTVYELKLQCNTQKRKIKEIMKTMQIA